MASNKSQTHDYKVGDILSARWGYSMIIVSYYQVVKVTPKMVEVKELNIEVVEGNSMRGESMPVKDSFAPYRNWKSESYKRKVNPDGSIDVNNSIRAYRWDGLPQYHDHWD